MAYKSFLSDWFIRCRPRRSNAQKELEERGSFNEDDAMGTPSGHSMDNIAENLATTKRAIAAAAHAAGRDPAAIALIAVSKFHDGAAVRAAMAAGQTRFGENRVQEAAEKFAALRTSGLELHLIGPLQTNKAEEAVRLFDVIQTLDRERLAAALAKAIQKTGRQPRLYVEVNIGQEEQKAGIAPEALGDFLRLCRETYALSITGLMCIPPQAADPVPHFQMLKSLADRHALPHLSMGMSADFTQAIACGATEVRIGTAIFGARV